jgi:hypothetical protein
VGSKTYKNLERIVYKSERYGKQKTVEYGYWSDGATGACDLSGAHPVYNRELDCDEDKSESWLVHDKLKEDKKWDDGTVCTNLQASFVIKDILKSEGRWFRDFWWFTATLAWGEFTKVKDKVFKHGIY